MSNTNKEILAILRHYWKLGRNAVDAARILREVEGHDAISDRTAQNWYKKFKEGHTDLQEEPRSGRPSVVDHEVICQRIEANPATSTRQLSQELGPSRWTIGRHLHQLGKTSKRCREVPHDLTAKQAEERVKICKELLTNPQDQRFYRRIVTCDEKWIYLRNPNKSNQWLSRGQPAEPVVKRKSFETKVMLCVWWNYEGVLHFELVPEGRAMNSELYCEQLDRMYTVLKEKYPALVNRKHVLFQQDNARPHTSRRTLQKLDEFDGVKLLPHPAYSPDLAPSDFHLFRSMAHFLSGRTFDNIADVEEGCREFFSSKPKDWYLKGIENLSRQWQRTIDHNGIYFEY
jgi:[histone H3]-lysine36 N-dimethyltransferase SETMAR